MPRTIAAVALFALSLSAGITASQIGNRITLAPSARAAAPMAAPFAFLTATTAASFCLSIVALSERPARRRSAIK